MRNIVTVKKNVCSPAAIWLSSALIVLYATGLVGCSRTDTTDPTDTNDPADTTAPTDTNDPVGQVDGKWILYRTLIPNYGYIETTAIFSESFNTVLLMAEEYFWDSDIEQNCLGTTIVHGSYVVNNNTLPKTLDIKITKREETLVCDGGFEDEDEDFEVEYWKAIYDFIADDKRMVIAFANIGGGYPAHFQDTSNIEFGWIGIRESDLPDFGNLWDGELAYCQQYDCKKEGNVSYSKEKSICCNTDDGPSFVYHYDEEAEQETYSRLCFDDSSELWLYEEYNITLGKRNLYWYDIVQNQYFPF